MWFPFVAKEGFVCLGCGYMGHYLDERDLERLRSEEARPKRPLDEL
jgi:hypothetical protein